MILTAPPEGPPPRRNRPGRVAIVGLGVVVASVLGITAAAAASLGGLSPPGVGADTTTVTSCDTDGVTLHYATEYEAQGFGAGRGDVVVTAATVGGLASGCSGLTLTVTLADNSGRAVGRGTGTVGAPSQVVMMTPAVRVSDVASVGVVVSD